VRNRLRAGGLISRARWYEFLPELALVAGLGLFALTEPHAAASGFKSTKAVVLMVTVAIVWIVGRLALWAGVRWPAVRLVVFAVAAAAILKVVVLPAYDNHTVTEVLPVDVRRGDTSSPAAPAGPAEPVKVKSGELRGIDHRASGTAALYGAPEGRVIVGLEQFDIQPGPAYVLYVVSGADRRDHDGGTRIEPLRGNRGTQFYDAPSSVDLTSGEWTVLVWCETFDVPVANATPIAV
jgi:4-amino-4-deoxy-L-arabinose transferase-like glycosyltransferase